MSPNVQTRARAVHLHLHYGRGSQLAPREKVASCQAIGRSLPGSRLGQDSPYLSVAVKARQVSAGTVRVTPSRSVVSRTVTPWFVATSTHCPPLLPL